MTEILAQGPIFLICLAFLLGVVVIIHELGHYIAGRWYGAAVESFSIGFGKSIYERKDRNNTRWRVNWIPLGGFVKFVGESQMPGDVGKVEAGPIGKPYGELSVGARSVVALAGPIANFVLAIFLFAIFFGVRGTEQYDVYAYQVNDGYPAAEAGMLAGDVIRSVDGSPIREISDMIVITTMSSGRPLDFVIERGGETQTLVVTPRRVVRENQLGQVVPQGTIGVIPAPDLESLEYRRFGPIQAVGMGMIETRSTVEHTVYMLGRIITGKEPLGLMSGPVAIGDAGRRIVNQTMGAESVPLTTRVSALAWSVLQLCALISIGIGFFNLLPLPVLDGGHLVFNAYEAATGKMLPEKVQEVALMAGLGLLLTMFVFITWGDVLETGLFSRSTGG
ncbi:MAG: M50 family metallopeptidase [Pseudomonadota bacterium]|nr:M50 family metallopeptidase [Pseudomonadota bacterium]